jgi:hypothetical protein
MNAATKLSRKIVTAQNMDEARTAAYANDPQTELIILGVSENPAVTTCGWARGFFGPPLNLDPTSLDARKKERPGSVRFR